MKLVYRTQMGADILPLIPEIADLRIRVFRDWPYLYDGDLAYEQRYLQGYASNPRSVVVTAEAEGRVVGVATGMPLEDHADSFAEALGGHDMPQDQVFYCAESVLLEPFRGRGAGHVFFDAREAQARTSGRRWSMFCAVQRPDDHPAKPVGYRALDEFWRGRGYRPLPGAVARFAWRDVDAAGETEKRLQVWVKDMSRETAADRA